MKVAIIFREKLRRAEHSGLRGMRHMEFSVRFFHPYNGQYKVCQMSGCTFVNQFKAFVSGTGTQ